MGMEIEEEEIEFTGPFKKGAFKNINVGKDYEEFI